MVPSLTINLNLTLQEIMVNSLEEFQRRKDQRYILIKFQHLKATTKSEQGWHRTCNYRRVAVTPDVLVITEDSVMERISVYQNIYVL